MIMLVTTKSTNQGTVDHSVIFDVEKFTAVC